MVFVLIIQTDLVRRNIFTGADTRGDYENDDPKFFLKIKLYVGKMSIFIIATL